MFNFILKLSIRHRYVVVSLTVLSAIIGIASYQNLIIDAVPDITNVQVQINTEARGYSPYEVERTVTVPIERTLAGLPGLESTRSLSRYGLSQVTVVFKDKTDIYFARQLISQGLQEAKESLPAGISPTMGPIATGLGEIMMFVVEEAPDSPKRYSLQELREAQDWIVKPQLRTVPGVIEVNSIGGASKAIVVTPDLEKLRAYELTFDDIALAIAGNNANVGAGFIEQNGEQFLVRVPAQVTSLGDIELIGVGVHEGVPVYVRDVATVQVGSELRNGAATEDGKEVVLGTVFMLKGENGRVVSERVTEKLKSVATSLPEGMVVKALYNRSDLVNATIATVKKNLVEGALLVIAVLFAALGNFRAAVITALVIPLSMLITIFGMAQATLSANLMSLGALDFGLIVDGAVILVENCIKRFAEAQKQLGRRLTRDERLTLVYEASSEVRQATMFGELIIMIVYVPILALSGIEGKMYHPMALTVILALLAAFVLSLTFVPAAVALFLTGNVRDHEGGWMSRLQNAYRRMLGHVMRVPTKVLSVLAALIVVSVVLFTRLGSEFIPSLDEGDVALHALRIPGTSLEQSIRMQHQLEEAIKTVPEVAHVFAKIGTAEVATDPMPPSIADGYVILKPRSQWSDSGKPKAEVVAELERVAQKIPGNNYEFTQPIQMRFNELIAGVRSDVAVKIFGDDSNVLLEQGEAVSKILGGIRGASDVKVEQVTGLPLVEIKPNREKIARLGLNVSDVQAALATAYAGKEISRFYEGDRNFPVILRAGEKERHQIDSIAQLPIPLVAEAGPDRLVEELKRPTLKSEPVARPFVLLQDVADIVVSSGPNQISRESGKRRVVVTANVRSRDLGSFVEEAQAAVATQLKLPAGYWLGWGGQFENLVSAQARLSVVVPIVLASVFGLIFFTFWSFRYSLLVFSGIPFSLTGGIIALWLRGIPFSISAAVGFIALSGVSVLNGLVLVSFIRHLIAQGYEQATAIVEGAVARLRPVLMTAMVASLGFIPMAISQGTGSEVQRPLATVVIGGIISSTLLTLVVLPVLINWRGGQK
jgi:cobalt-zinc-cadmium resistance protein CzcA